jgi:hypothetical protein
MYELQLEVAARYGLCKLQIPFTERTERHADPAHCSPRVCASICGGSPQKFAQLRNRIDVLARGLLTALRLGKELPAPRAAGALTD